MLVGGFLFQVSHSCSDFSDIGLFFKTSLIGCLSGSGCITLASHHSGKDQYSSDFSLELEFFLVLHSFKTYIFEK